MDPKSLTPDSLVEHGCIHCGIFDRPFRNTNLLDASQPGHFLGKAFRRLRLKEWVGFGMDHPEVYGAVLLQNSGYVASGVFYLYDKESGRKEEWQLLDLPTRLRLPESLWNSRSQCGNARRGIVFEHRLERSHHRVQARIPETRKQPGLTADVVFHQELSTVDPLVVSLPIPPAHHTYTHKSPVRIEGRICVGDREYAFLPERDRGNLDEQKTYYPYRSRWHWGCFSCASASGDEVTVNLVDQMTEKGAPSEDAMWVNGRLMMMPPAAFIPDGDGGRFRIEDDSGTIRLRFSPLGAKAERRNYLVVAMDYKQYFGLYEGEVRDDAGHVHVIKNAFGALEKMRARF